MDMGLLWPYPNPPCAIPKLYLVMAWQFVGIVTLLRALYGVFSDLLSTPMVWSSMDGLATTTASRHALLEDAAFGEPFLQSMYCLGQWLRWLLLCALT
jgi:hypothetical protein